MATYKVRIENKEYEVTVIDVSGGSAEVTVEGQTFHVEPVGRMTRAQTTSSSATTPTAPSTPKPPPTSPSGAPPAMESGSIHAPIPGVVTKICVTPGETVEANQIVLKLEAMKMENDIATPVAGTVEEIAVSEGAEVRDGQLLIVVG